MDALLLTLVLTTLLIHGGLLYPLQTKLKNCRLVINEWNAGTTDVELQFVELRAYCHQTPQIRSSVDMSRYRLVVLNPLQQIMLMCHPKVKKSFKSKTEFYFVFGGDKVNNADMRFSECQVDSFLRKQRKLYLPTGIVYPFSLGLFYNQRTDALNFTELLLTENFYHAKAITDTELLRLGSWVQDFYVYGSSTRLLTCDVFQAILSEHAEKGSKIIRDWQTEPLREDYSVNRCTGLEDDRSFLSSGFRYSVPTPGELNRCTESFRFFIESTLPELTALKKIPTTMHGKTHYCYIHTSDPDTESIITTEENFELQMDIAEQQPPENVPMDIDEPCGGTPACTYAQNNSIISDFYIPPDIVKNKGDKYLWNECSQFPRVWVEELRRDNDTPLNVSIFEDPRVCFWYEYLTAKKVGRCKLCNALLEQGIVYKSRLDSLMRVGYMYRTQTKNRKNINAGRIMQHTHSDVHKISLQYFGCLDQGLVGANLTQAMMRKDGAYYQYYAPTENLLISVYQAVKMGLSFRSFRIFTDTLKFFKINIGTVHSNEVGMKKILMHVERMMRNDLANYLRLHRPEVSITLDSSIDIAGKPSLAVLFQTFVEGNRQKIFFYRLLPLVGESGEDLFNAFKSALEADRLDQYVREKISGYVSDGCSVMTSTFLAELRKWAVSGFINTWCVSHRIELVSKNSLRKQPVVKHIESRINALATFFGPISPKKRRVLDAAALKLGYNLFKIQRIHDIRWSESKHKAMSVIINKWDAIVDALQKISLSRDFKKATKDSAKELIRCLTDGTFLSTLAFLVDVTEVFTEFSQLLQQRTTTLVGKRTMVDTFRQRISYLRENYGQRLSALLQNSVYADQTSGTPTLVDFETRAVTYLRKNISSSGAYNASLLLTVQRRNYASQLLQKLNEYFAESNATNFDIFDPIQMEINIDKASFGVPELLSMNSQYRWNYNVTSLLHGWFTLRRNVVLHAEFPKLATEKPELFWMYFLNLEDEEVGWTDITRGLLRKVLSVGASSSEAERIFSISNAQKSKRRYNLKVETVSALVAIRFNGVQDLKRLESFRYAKEFVREHLKADDLSRKNSTSIADDEDYFLIPFDPDYNPQSE